MSPRLSRRDVLKLGATALAPVVLRDARQPIVIGGTPVEIAVAAISPLTSRILVRPFAAEESLTSLEDGALAEDFSGRRFVSSLGPGFTASFLTMLQ